MQTQRCRMHKCTWIGGSWATICMPTGAFDAVVQYIFCRSAWPNGAQRRDYHFRLTFECVYVGVPGSLTLNLSPGAAPSGTRAVKVALPTSTWNGSEKKEKQRERQKDKKTNKQMKKQTDKQENRNAHTNTNARSSSSSNNSNNSIDKNKNV